MRPVARAAGAPVAYERRARTRAAVLVRAGILGILSALATLGLAASPALPLGDAAAPTWRLVPPEAWAAPRRPHAHLVSASPTPGDTLRGPPERIELVFSAPIEEAFAAIDLRSGGAEPIRLSPSRDPANVRSLLAEPPALAPGAYRLEWRVVSADGHPVAGSYVFFVAPDGTPAATIPSQPPPPETPGGVTLSQPPPERAGGGTLSEPAPPEKRGGQHGGAAGATGEPPVAAALARAASLAALLALVGLLAMEAWIVPGRAPRLVRVATWIAGVAPLLLAADFLLWAQHAAPAGVLDAEVLTASLRTRTGLVSALRIGASASALWALVLVRRPGLAAGFALVALLLSSDMGHPAAIDPAFAVPAKAIHLAAVAVWLGGLLALILGSHDAARFPATARRVSRVALFSVVAIAATGLLQAFLFLPSPADLVASAYGLLVLAKTAGLGALVLFGARHRFRLLPRLLAGAPDAELRRSVRAQVLIMAAVLVAAAFLAYVPPPPERAAQAEGPRHARAMKTPEVLP